MSAQNKSLISDKGYIKDIVDWLTDSKLQFKEKVKDFYLKRLK